MEQIEPSLVDFLAGKAGCVYISDLTHLTEYQQVLLLDELFQLPPEAASEKEWNEALGYIEGLPAQHSAAEARERLIAALGGGRHKKA